MKELFESGKSRKVDAKLAGRVLRRLDVLDQASLLSDLDAPGFDFHRLRRHKPPRYTLHVNGPWCITFEWMDGDALKVDLEQYH